MVNVFGPGRVHPKEKINVDLFYCISITLPNSLQIRMEINIRGSELH